MPYLFTLFALDAKTHAHTRTNTAEMHTQTTTGKETHAHTRTNTGAPKTTTGKDAQSPLDSEATPSAGGCNKTQQRCKRFSLFNPSQVDPNE